MCRKVSNLAGPRQGSCEPGQRVVVTGSGECRNALCCGVQRLCMSVYVARDLHKVWRDAISQEGASVTWLSHRVALLKVFCNVLLVVS